MNLYAANGFRIKFYGFTNLYISVGFTDLMKHQFAVCNAETPIIGSDFIVSHELVINLKQSKILKDKTLIDLISVEGYAVPINTAITSDFIGKHYPGLPVGD